MAKMEAAQLASELAHFTGSEGYTRASGIMRDLVMTDGVKFLCDNAECYWLMDVIASHNLTNRKVRAEPFQTWNLALAEAGGSNKGARITMTDGGKGGDEEPVPIVTQEVEFTDFPLPSIKLFVADGWANGNVRVVMLPRRRVVLAMLDIGRIIADVR